MYKKQRSKICRENCQKSMLHNSYFSKEAEALALCFFKLLKK